MDISKINQNFSDAIKEVEKDGLVTITKFNKPSYVFMTYDFFQNLSKYFSNLDNIVEEKKGAKMKSQYTLHEAMQVVLRTQPQQTMRYNVLANEIWDKGLYRKNDGKKASSGQVRLRAKNYPALFDLVGEKGHFITLK